MDTVKKISQLKEVVKVWLQDDRSVELQATQRVAIVRNSLSGVSLANNLKVGDIITDLNAPEYPRPDVMR